MCSFYFLKQTKSVFEVYGATLAWYIYLIGVLRGRSVCTSMPKGCIHRRSREMEEFAEGECTE